VTASEGKGPETGAPAEAAGANPGEPKGHLLALARSLLDSPLPTLSKLQESRGLWLAGAGVALFLEIFSVLYFQKYLGLLPCEYCVQIRFDVLIVCLGGLVAAASPAFKPIKYGGWLLSFIGAAVGLKNSFVLEEITVRTLHDPGYFPVCRPGKVDFIFDLKLDNWLPTHFSPDGICGEAPWIFLDLTMSQWLIAIFPVMLISLALVLVSSFLAKSSPSESQGGHEAEAGAAH
jgi:disulfide bond formation protein DsbB